MHSFSWLSKQPYLLLFLTALFWAGNAIAGKLAVGHISPFMLTTLRWSLAALLLLPFTYTQLLKDWGIIRPRLLFLFALGTIGFTCFNNLQYLALNSTTAINSAIIQSSLPFFIFVLSFVISRIRVNKYQFIGFPITLIGVVIIAAQGRLSNITQLDFNAGDILMVVAMFAYGIYSVMIKDKPAAHWQTIILVLACSACIASTPFAVYEVATQAVIWPDWVGMGAVLYTAIFSAVLAQIFWIRSIELIGANAAGMFINLVPALATLLAIVILGEQLYAYHVVGMLLILLGVSYAQKNTTVV